MSVPVYNINAIIVTIIVTASGTSRSWEIWPALFFLLDSDGLISSWLFRLGLVLFHTPFCAVHDGSPSRFLTCFYHSLLGSLSTMGLVVLRTMCSVGWERNNGWDRKEGHGKETA